ncbi:MAG: ArsR family transcriptional regulator [Deltaproteobacteria bacterium]|nr:MAG: ArsR family transcriptional regulator [Deltaproteobacteria bacterium]
MNSAGPIVRLYRALGDETRLRMVHLLAAAGELCVCELEAALDIPQSTASRHLRVLRDAGLVRDRRAGAWVHYRVHEDLPEPARDAVASVVRTFGRTAAGRADLARATRSRRCCD